MNMSTHIIFTLMPNTGVEDQLRGLFVLCSDNISVIGTIHEYINDDTEERIFDTVFKDKDEAKKFIYEFFYQMTFMNHDFVGVTPDMLTIESDDQEIYNFINSQMNKSCQYDINILDSICSELAEDQSNMDNRLSAIENYINSSGIIHYKQFMEELINVLDAKDMLDKGSILNKMFETIH